MVRIAWRDSSCALLRTRHDLMHKVREFLLSATDLVFPPHCLLCRSFLPTVRRHLFCVECQSTMIDTSSIRCPTCARRAPEWLTSAQDCPSCRRRPPRFLTTICVGDYADALRTVILQSKKAQNEAWVMSAGSLLAERIEASGYGQSIDQIVPLPSHTLRRFRRWYNTAELLACEVAKSVKLDLLRNALKYTRPTYKQGTLSRNQRLANLHGSMRLSEMASLKGSRVLLVDDVITSGSTANEAARVCLRAGATEVRLAVVARGSGQI